VRDRTKVQILDGINQEQVLRKGEVFTNHEKRKQISATSSSHLPKSLAFAPSLFWIFFGFLDFFILDFLLVPFSVPLDFGFFGDFFVLDFLLVPFSVPLAPAVSFPLARKVCFKVKNSAIK
jgi:hypothetical protein